MTTLALHSTTFVARDPDWIFRELHDPRTLVGMVPGATITRIRPHSFAARIAVGLGPLRSHVDGTGRITSSDARRRTASLEVNAGPASHFTYVSVKMAMSIMQRTKGAEILMRFDVVTSDHAGRLAQGWLNAIAWDLLDRTTRRLKQQLEVAAPTPLLPAA